MSPITIFVLCIQALLIQVHYGAARRYTLVNGPSAVDVYRLRLPYDQLPTVVSQQCGCGSSGYSAPPISYSAGCSSGSSYSSGSCSSGSSYSSGSCGGYGGQGSGEVSVAGNIDACGTTCVTGAVPVLGSVCFGGCAPACGSVSICGQCGCGCQ